MVKIRSALKKIMLRLLGHTRSPGSVSPTSTDGAEPRACQSMPLPTDLTLENLLKSSASTSSITTRRFEAAARRRGPAAGMADPKGRHVTAHYSIGMKSGRSCDGRPRVHVRAWRLLDGDFCQVTNVPFDTYTEALSYCGARFDLTDAAFEQLCEGQTQYNGYWIEMELGI